MKLRCGYIFIFYLFAFMPLTASSHHQVVLVTNTSCPINTISSLDLRKIYFGFNVRHDGFSIKGIRNLSDEQLDKIFHQTVVAMSSKSYQRRLLAQTLNIGKPRIAEFSNIKALLLELRKSPCNITYMWGMDVDLLQELKIIKLLWHEH